MSLANAVTEAQQYIRKFQEKHDFSLDMLRRQPLQLEETLWRIQLIQEELAELTEALAKGDVVAVADALGDLEYVVLGAGNALGIDLGPVTEEIHRSNMTKTPGNGHHPKGAKYSPPNLTPILVRQGLI